MAYIYLEELKKILPEIMRDWIDKDDESWEWIFQEIEQKCHVGKKEKKKKKVSKIDAIEIAIMAHRNDINECNRKITNLSDVYTGKVQQMQLTINDLRAEVMHLRSEITAAKSMAETAKQRTEVDYSKYSGKSDGKEKYDLSNFTIRDYEREFPGIGALRYDGDANIIYEHIDKFGHPLDGLEVDNG